MKALLVHHAVHILVALLQIKNIVITGIGLIRVKVALTWTTLLRVVIVRALVLHSVIVLMMALLVHQTVLQVLMGVIAG